MKRRGHLFCAPNGHVVVEPCSGRGQPLVARPARSGEPLHPGQALVQITPLEDGHVEYETVHREKPVQVATPAYRSGWDAAFGAGNRTVN